ncbi:MAG: hypothetical protein ACI82S_003341 [Patiriisocius sp.]|jgi:hypothetical protein
MLRRSIELAALSCPLIHFYDRQETAHLRSSPDYLAVSARSTMQKCRKPNIIYLWKLILILTYNKVIRAALANGTAQ